GILSVDAALGDMKEVFLGEGDVKKAKRGIPLPLKQKNLGLQKGDYIKLKDADGRLFGIGRVEDNQIKIERILYL
ncbi:MAG: hypothetical protein ACK415_12450, partial [Thermodesulfovibrionales bacterium]